ncbi:MAG: thiolase family protein [Treponema sp.]|jgi:acetyl-CoA acyltransferase|nr:thiolase family protein [Treponema sp.]
MGKEAVIVAYGRSPCCRARKGNLVGTHPIEYAAETLTGVLNRAPGLPRDRIDDIIVGCAMPVHHMDYNVARLIALRASLPERIPGHTINRFCSSSLQAIATGANAIIAGQMHCVIAGGVEDMTDCFAPTQEAYMDQWLQDHNQGAYMTMGETAERVADKYGITREEMDAMAVESHVKAHRAQGDGKLSPSIIPVTNRDGFRITADEGIRPDTTMEILAGLKPAFRENGRVTAGNSSQTTDAAAFVVLMSSDMADQFHIKPLARFVGFSVTGCDPSLMGLGPLYAVPRVMELTGLSVMDMDTIELNEAFAVQALACIRELGLPREKVNPYGGAMALGHPMGATGALLTEKAIDFLQDTDQRYALITMCVGGGMGAAGIFERLRSKEFSNE